MHVGLFKRRRVDTPQTPDIDEDKQKSKILSLTLDATAGNRMMWKNKYPPMTIFMDKKLDLSIPPDIVGVWEACPFRNSVFGRVIFDPPHIVRSGGYDPRFGLHRKYGAWESKREAIISIYKAQIEFARLAFRLCFKWCETRDGPTLWGLMPLFDKWKKVFERERKTLGYGKIRGSTYWITFELAEEDI